MSWASTHQECDFDRPIDNFTSTDYSGYLLSGDAKSISASCSTSDTAYSATSPPPATAARATIIPTSALVQTNNKSHPRTPRQKRTRQPVFIHQSPDRGVITNNKNKNNHRSYSLPRTSRIKQGRQDKIWRPRRTAAAATIGAGHCQTQQDPAFGQ